MYDHILVRYGELGLKGKNQSQFLKTLVTNIRRQLKKDLGRSMRVEREQGRVLIHLDGTEAEACYPTLNRVYGIASYSPVRAVALDKDAILQAAVEEMRLAVPEPTTFRVTVKRANKRFPVRSKEMQLETAQAVLAALPYLEPNLTDHAVALTVDIRFEHAYLYVHKFAGLGGLPLGTGGRALLMLSGGIDSPVAGWAMMRRGVVIEAVHFHSYPYTSKEAEDKVLNLADRLARYSGHMVVHLVPFTRIQEDIGQHCHENMRITIMRRIMMRICEAMAPERHASAVVTGDNLGQVASQTIESLAAIETVITMPVLRPLVAMDKVEIMAQARAIDTYDISVLPYEDCCTVFVPKEPKTRPKAGACDKEEHRLDLPGLIQDAISRSETVVCYGPGEDRVRRPFVSMEEGTHGE